MSLYALEKLFHKECNGHGHGLGKAPFNREDISFDIYGQDVNIQRNSRTLFITAVGAGGVYGPLKPKTKAKLLDALVFSRPKK